MRESEKESYLREERQRWFHQAREIGERGGSKDSVHPAVVTRERESYLRGERQRR